MKHPVKAILEKLKCHLFLEKQRIGRQNRSCGVGIGTSRRGEDVRKCCRRVNMTEILGTHVCELKYEFRNGGQ
jgi:hypothetical protein